MSDEKDVLCGHAERLFHHSSFLTHHFFKIMAVNAEQKIACEALDFAAYLDGEADAATQQQCETHIAACTACAAQLREQRALLCELDFLLAAGETDIALPANFAEVVTVRAQAAMSGVRTRQEHAKALRWCALLGLTGFALLGGAWREMLWRPLRQLCILGATALDFIAHAFYQTGVGLAVVARTLSGHLLFKSFSLNLLAAFLWLAAIVFLKRLISHYHRSHPLN